MSPFTFEGLPKNKHVFYAFYKLAYEKKMKGCFSGPASGLSECFSPRLNDKI